MSGGLSAGTIATRRRLRISAILPIRQDPAARDEPRDLDGSDPYSYERQPSEKPDMKPEDAGSLACQLGGIPSRAG
jgi:hypothetical protein